MEKKTFFCLRRERMETSLKTEISKESHLMFFFRCKIQHRPPTRKEPKSLSIVFSNERVPPGMLIWWTCLFLAFLRPEFAGVRWGKQKSEHQHFVWVCQIFYSTWNLKWWSGDSPSQVEKEINFFLTFHCTYILKKETKLFNAVKGYFHLFAVKGGFVP